ncbi:hypothetical protein A9306_08895 [Moraxella atlantae]|uniref:Uncharacterized protein n=1 Tax=Faucicola atlantae TaxID=34059 RepID=A0A1B8QD05_9GAMM|nr:hypothetical protein A9306_08895 [Moraxella atlantae]
MAETYTQQGFQPFFIGRYLCPWAGSWASGFAGFGLDVLTIKAWRWFCVKPFVFLPWARIG